MKLTHSKNGRETPPLKQITLPSPMEGGTSPLKQINPPPISDGGGWGGGNPMKLTRFGNPGQEKPGVIDGDNHLRDASAIIKDWRGEALSDESLARIIPEELPLVAGKPRRGPPVAGVGKIVGIGLNYREHAAESGMQLPDDPIIFFKSPGAIKGPDDDIVIPRESEKTDWEVELAVVIGKGGKNISEKDALSHVCGYAIGLDLSEREWQLRRGAQWAKGKSADTFAPLGPWLAARAIVPDPQNLELFLSVNGEKMQSGSTGDMHFSVAALISRVSGYMSWQAGDVMLTGTPPGVGLGKKPPRFLRPGDTVRASITGLGEQNARVVAAD